jgi:hypothetical protein
LRTSSRKNVSYSSTSWEKELDTAAILLLLQSMRTRQRQADQRDLSSKTPKPPQLDRFKPNFFCGSSISFKLTHRYAPAGRHFIRMSRLAANDDPNGAPDDSWCDITSSQKYKLTMGSTCDSSYVGLCSMMKVPTGIHGETVLSPFSWYRSIHETDTSRQWTIFRSRLPSCVPLGFAVVALGGVVAVVALWYKRKAQRRKNVFTTRTKSSSLRHCLRGGTIRATVAVREQANAASVTERRQPGALGRDDGAPRLIIFRAPADFPASVSKKTEEPWRKPEAAAPRRRPPPQHERPKTIRRDH